MFGSLTRRRPIYVEADRSFWVGILSFILFFVYAVVLYHVSDKKSGYYPLYLLMLVQLTPFLYCFIKQSYNYVAFILFNHFFSFSIAKLNQLNLLGMSEIYPEALVAIYELIICTIFTIVGYFVLKMFLPINRPKEKFQLLSLQRWQLLFVSLYVILVPVFLKYLPAWFLAFHFTTIGADMMLLLSSNCPGHELLAKALRLGVLVSTLWYFLATGTLTMVGVLAAYIFIAGCIRRDPKLFILPVLLTLVGSTIQTVKSDYRRYLIENPEHSVIDRFSTLAEMISVSYASRELTDMSNPVVPQGNGDDDEEGTDDKLRKGFARVGDDSLERVLDWTPRKVPFWGGETYAHIPFMFIPRVLWPDKPSRHIWNRFGREYGYLSEDDFATSVAVNYLAEAYMSFNFFGMYTIAFLFGAFAYLVEILSWTILKGHFAFTFMIFLIPLQWYAADLGSILNSVLIIIGVLFTFRTQFQKMARKDEYSY